MIMLKMKITVRRRTRYSIERRSQISRVSRSRSVQLHRAEAADRSSGQTQPARSARPFSPPLLYFILDKSAVGMGIQEHQVKIMAAYNLSPRQKDLPPNPPKFESKSGCASGDVSGREMHECGRSEVETTRKRVRIGCCCY